VPPALAHAVGMYIHGKLASYERAERRVREISKRGEGELVGKITDVLVKAVGMRGYTARTDGVIDTSTAITYGIAKMWLSDPRVMTQVAEEDRGIMYTFAKQLVGRCYYWTPSRQANPHVLISGASGSGCRYQSVRLSRRHSGRQAIIRGYRPAWSFDRIPQSYTWLKGWVGGGGGRVRV